jgi:hypothetical protein
VVAAESKSRESQGVVSLSGITPGALPAGKTKSANVKFCETGLLVSGH